MSSLESQTHIFFCSVHALPLPPTEDHAWAGQTHSIHQMCLISTLPYLCPLPILVSHYQNISMLSSPSLHQHSCISLSLFAFMLFPNMCLPNLHVFPNMCLPSLNVFTNMCVPSLHVHSLHSPASPSHSSLPPPACLPPVDDGNISIILNTVADFLRA